MLGGLTRHTPSFKVQLQNFFLLNFLFYDKKNISTLPTQIRWWPPNLYFTTCTFDFAIYLVYFQISDKIIVNQLVSRLRGEGYLIIKNH